MFFSGLFQRKSDAPVTTPAELADAIGLSYDTYTGKQISSQRAMRLTAVFSCVRVLAESVGMLPCNLYHLNGSLKQRATGERLHKLISTHPNGYMTPQEFWELVVTCLCLRGNFYAYKVKAFGEVAELLPVDPGCVVPKINSSWEPIYQVTFPDGSTDVLSQEDIWHVRTLTLDGLVGLNPIAYAREAISLAAATEEHGARLFSNGAVTSGVLRTEQTLSDQAYERLKKDFEERHTGLGNAHRPMILEMGLDWKSMALNAEDSQSSPITLEPWQLFVICCAFGWVNKGTRLRRFREVYTEIPRKNGKSAISAGVALYCFACDNEFGAEVYSGATTEKQAWEVFRPARLMCKRTPMLTEAFGIEVNASNMNRPEDGARFEPLIGNPGDGSSPHCAVVDEYHEHATDALYTTMLTGMGARRQPLMWAITTAGYNIEGPCYDKRREVIEMLNGSVPNDELFGIIYTVDEGDDWTNPQVLEKANPNIGVSVYREFLLSQQQRAKNNARLANVFKTKHLNIWVSARSAYFNLVSWQSCEDKSLTLEQFEGQPCILAFDLARKLDMNSMARLYTREIDGKTHYYSVAPRFWVPYDTVYSVEKNEDRRTAERFQKWVEMGVLTVTDGAEVDYRYILEEAKAANKISPVSESPIDPFGATGLSHDLADEDLNPVTIIQNYTNMSDPMKELEAAIESGRFHHDGNPIMTWCIGNVVGKTIPGNDDVVKPVKEQAENKIDGAVALIMAVGRAMLYEKEDTLSDHIESYGIRSL